MTIIETSGHTTIAQLMQARQNEMGTTDHEIAVALGYDHDRVIEMLKRGTLTFPLNRTIELARVLNVDAAAVLRLALSESNPDLLTVIERVMGPMASRQEKQAPLSIVPSTVAD
jgi:hypothetical protein